jgi:hypothetical protein
MMSKSASESLRKMLDDEAEKLQVPIFTARPPILLHFVGLVFYYNFQKAMWCF